MVFVVCRHRANDLQQLIQDRVYSAVSQAIHGQHWSCVIYTVVIYYYYIIIKGKRWSICIAPRRENLTSKALRCGSHSLTCEHTTPAFTRSSPEGATTE